MNHMDSYLYLALVHDNVNVLEGKDWLNQMTPANNTVLHLACQHGSMGCVNQILSAHVSCTLTLLLQTNSRDETALHLAARQGHYGVVEALINKAKSLDAAANCLQITSSTVLQGLIRAPDVERETALHAAVRYNHENVVRLIVEEDPSYAYPRNNYDETPLYLAALRGYAGVTKVILDNCESQTFGGPHGRTALHAALMNSSFVANECVKLLPGKNKDLIKVADNNGWTAFHYAAHNNLSELVKFLVQADKSVAYLADKIYGRTAIHVAAYKGHEIVLMVLLKYLPDAWESVDGNGQNILHIALMQGQKYLIGFIFSGILDFDIKNALLTQRDKDGNTPLHLIAKFECYIPQLQNINDWKVDWDLVDNTNLTPIEVFHKYQTGTLIDKALVGVTVDRTRAKFHWNRWIKDKVSDVENGTGEEECEKWHKEMVNTHMIVAALITTVPLTAGFAMPGGFYGNQGPDQGSAVLLGKTAFKTFVIADTIALLCSMSSLFIYFLTPMNHKKLEVDRMILVAVVLNFVSITAMMLAFIAGTAAVLSHSSPYFLSLSFMHAMYILGNFSRESGGSPRKHKVLCIL